MEFAYKLGKKQDRTRVVVSATDRGRSNRKKKQTL